MQLTRVRVTRDSVAMGDDTNAPHLMFLELLGDPTIEIAVRNVLECPYLATIQGGEATWLVVADGTVHAVVAQQWEAPRWITGRDVRAPAEIHFRYLRQEDPEAVLAQQLVDAVSPEDVTVTISRPHVRGLLITCRLGEREKDVHGELLVTGDHEWSIIKSTLVDHWTRPPADPMSNTEARVLVTAVVQRLKDEGIRVRWD
ncbi:hypothetical protein FKR81_34220 [Lentzea tibetensis]|uniref:Uncharacterized protein n=1 Tax=Lentzea tibetensis TaxID=2591470 RepID=A0A563EJ30_9PSEU|nr:hypothetical protein [Lentzea tibetensis]TWP46866.1 hypothetical protein FKR81_34220 [Lentzea tibetensis]